MARPADDRALGRANPVSFEGTVAEKAAYTADVFRMLERRISIFCSLPMHSIDKLALQKRLDEIGKSRE